MFSLNAHNKERPMKFTSEVENENQIPYIAIKTITVSKPASTENQHKQIDIGIYILITLETITTILRTINIQIVLDNKPKETFKFNHTRLNPTIFKPLLQLPLLTSQL